MTEDFIAIRKRFQDVLFTIEWERLKAVRMAWFSDPYLWGYMSFNPLHPGSGRVGPGFDQDGDSDFTNEKEWKEATWKFFRGVEDARAHYKGEQGSEAIHPVFTALDKI